MVSPSIFFLTMNGNRCFEPSAPGLHDDILTCLFWIIALAPFGVVFGGLAHDEQQVSVVWNVVALAFCLGLAVALFQSLSSSIITRLRPRTQ